MSTLLFRLGRGAGRHPWRVVAIWLLAATAAVFLNASVGGATDETFRLPGAESQQGADLLKERFPDQSLFTSNVVFHDERELTTPEVRRAVTQAVRDLRTGPHVVDVTDPFASASNTLSGDGTTAFATITYDQDSTTGDMLTSADEAVAPLRAEGVEVAYDGALGYATAKGEGGTEVIGILIAVVVLAVAFGSLVAMSLPIVVALLAVLIGTSTLGVLAGVVAVPQIATVIGLMLGLGVGIDYALFVLSRHRQNLQSGMPVPDAIGHANATAGLSVLFAGGTVILAIVGVQVSGIPMLAMMGWGAAIMVAVTMVAALTLLPAVLGILRERVNHLQVPFLRRGRESDGLTVRWTRKVVARPATYAIGATLILITLSIPVLSMRLAFPDAGNDPQGTSTRVAYDLMADAYGPGTGAPMLVVLESERGPLPTGLAELVADRANSVDGVEGTSAPTYNGARDIAVVGVTPSSSPQDEASSMLLDRLRSETLPRLVNGKRVSAHVTGGPALTDDVAERLHDRMPLFLAAVIGLSFLLLVIVFRSVLVPAKAALLNLLSIGASYGVVVAIFQWGWAANLIGLEETVPIMPLAPMLMFAILFGLSMDYEVFLLSRIREHFVQHGDARRAVLEGVGATGRVITSAAVIMIAIFASFILATDATTKMFGVGLSVAVLLDVTLGRMVLVPTLMTLLGNRAWWLPASLDNWIPAVDLESAGGEPPVSSSHLGPVAMPKTAAHEMS